MEWRPIETAPKDGSWLMVYERSDFPPSVWVVRWGNIEGSGGWLDEKCWVTVGLGPNPDTYDADMATHWMPLPDPPKGA